MNLYINNWNTSLKKGNDFKHIYGFKKFGKKKCVTLTYPVYSLIQTMFDICNFWISAVDFWKWDRVCLPKPCTCSQWLLSVFSRWQKPNIKSVAWLYFSAALKHFCFKKAEHCILRNLHPFSYISQCSAPELKIIFFLSPKIKKNVEKDYVL